MPNAWDAGSAKILESIGFAALASSSAGVAYAAGRPDGDLTPSELVAAGALLTEALTIPVSADLENCGVAEKDIAATIEAAAAAGLAGGSVEDFTGNPNDPIYPLETAVARVRAAVAAARAAPADFVLTARAEGLLYGGTDLAEIIARLCAYSEAGADVLFAPGLKTPDQVAMVCEAVPGNVSVLVGHSGSGFTVGTLAQAGVARISLGSALSRQALGGLIRFARTLYEDGRFDYTEDMAEFAEIEGILAR